jgi:VanZ family protein
VSGVLVKRLLLAFWLGFIFYMSAQSDSGNHSSAIVEFLYGLIHRTYDPLEAETVHHGIRKLAHFSEYGILGCLWWVNLPQTWGVFKRLGVAWGLSSLYAASDEWHQMFVPGRGPSPVDVAIDSSGAFVGLLMVYGTSFYRWWRDLATVDNAN